jgi:sugar O-acyltransferase (sialic acid O-acetyltransferase NeuD family)
VAVLGAGGHAKVVIATLRAAGLEVAACFDDAEERHGTLFQGVEVRGPIAAAADWIGDWIGDRIEDADVRAVVAVGDNRARRKIVERLDLPWISVVHPAATVHESVALGDGTVVFAGAVLQPDTVVGRHGIVNTGASVDHDCRLGDFVHVAPGARLAGGVTVGDEAFLGIGSAVIPGIQVGARSTVGAGSAAVRPVPEGATVLGVPARVVRRRSVPR